MGRADRCMVDYGATKVGPLKNTLFDVTTEKTRTVHCHSHCMWKLKNDHASDDLQISFKNYKRHGIAAKVSAL